MEARYYAVQYVSSQIALPFQASITQISIG